MSESRYIYGRRNRSLDSPSRCADRSYVVAIAAARLRCDRCARSCTRYSRYHSNLHNISLPSNDLTRGGR
jgi:hypothetical protein